MALLLCGVTIFALAQLRMPAPSYGFTYSARHARSFGLDDYGTFERALADLQPSIVRLPVYWDEVEVSDDQFVFNSIDTLLATAYNYDVDIILAIGQKVPRDPECFLPAWTDSLSDFEREEQLISYITQLTSRYGDHPAIVRFQVENEALFPFGDCPEPSPSLLLREIAVVRQLTDLPIQLTASGEQQLWSSVAGPADVVGVSLYRYTWDALLGPIPFFHTPLWYRTQRLAIAAFAQVSISELQAEPWIPVGEWPPDPVTGYLHFTEARLREHVTFARQTGASEILFWGVEWWYYLHESGDDRLLEAAREIMKP
jgi:hypothetical protein